MRILFLLIIFFTLFVGLLQVSYKIIIIGINKPVADIIKFEGNPEKDIGQITDQKAEEEIIIETELENKKEEVKETSIAIMPTSVNHEIEFTSQVPYAIWDALHEEACEEAILVMIYAWFNNISLTQELAESEIKKLASWGRLNLGSPESSKAVEVAKMAKEVYNINARIIENPTIEDLKKEISNGNLVVGGMAGKLLNNPYYTPPGPVYHMLLLKGFDDEGFYTNYPGTRRGKNYFYPFEVIIKAAYDWSGSEETLLDSPPVFLVFSKLSKL